MIKKLTVAIIAILVVLAAALVFANYTSNNNSINSINNPINDSNMKKQDISASNTPTKENTTDTTKSQMKISPEESKKIAQKYIEEPGDTAGTPRLTKTSDGYEYIVPIINKGTDVGYISIDAQTGKNLGGARNT